MHTRFFAAGLLCLTFITASWAQGQPAVTDETSTLRAGDMAPDFELPDQSGNMVKLSDFRGKQNVVLAFFVLAFTGG